MSEELEAIKAHVKGAPTLKYLKELSDGLKDVFETIPGITATATITLKCDEKGCDNTTPFDITAGEQAIWEVANLGWTRVPEIPAHYCPTCSKQKTTTQPA